MAMYHINHTFLSFFFLSLALSSFYKSSYERILYYILQFTTMKSIMTSLYDVNVDVNGPNMFIFLPFYVCNDDVDVLPHILGNVHVRNVHELYHHPDTLMYLYHVVVPYLPILFHPSILQFLFHKKFSSYILFPISWTIRICHRTFTMHFMMGKFTNVSTFIILVKRSMYERCMNSYLV